MISISHPDTWHLICGEYPPDMGGVADYTESIAQALSDAGAEVHVWTSGTDGSSVAGRHGEEIHRLGGGFGLNRLARIDRSLERFAGPRTIFIQYVPHSFGWKSMNLPFAAWVAWRAARGDQVRVMFHEVAFPWVRRPLKHSILAAANRLMAALVIRACSRAYVSTKAWEPLLRRLGAGALPIIWSPVPSNVPCEADPKMVAARRAELIGTDSFISVVGHFGTYGKAIAGELAPALRGLLDSRRDIYVLLLGAGGKQWRAELAEGRADRLARIVATGPLPALEIAEYLKACDLTLQPYPDGASGRRGTLMANLANGVPVVTTIGPLSEQVWSEGVASVPVGDPSALVRLASSLLDRPDSLAELGAAGRRLYENQFAIRHTVATLLGPP